MSTGPIWLTGAFTAVMLGIALYCLGWLIVARRRTGRLHRTRRGRDARRHGHGHGWHAGLANQPTGQA
jgi:hypothetical protein